MRSKDRDLLEEETKWIKQKYTEEAKSYLKDKRDHDAAFMESAKRLLEENVKSATYEKVQKSAESDSDSSLESLYGTTGTGTTDSFTDKNTVEKEEPENIWITIILPIIVIIFNVAGFIFLTVKFG